MLIKKLSSELRHLVDKKSPRSDPLRGIIGSLRDKLRGEDGDNRVSDDTCDLLLDEVDVWRLLMQKRARDAEVRKDIEKRRDAIAVVVFSFMSTARLKADAAVPAHPFERFTPAA
jgi:hypothetical protein